MARFTFRLPDIGEGIAEAEIVAWHVRVGDKVEEDGRLADMMTGKATVEMESPVAGVVVELAGEVGAMVPIGAALVVLETEGEAAEEGLGPSSQAVGQRIRAETPDTEGVARVQEAEQSPAEQPDFARTSFARAEPVEALAFPFLEGKSGPSTRSGRSDSSGKRRFLNSAQAEPVEACPPPPTPGAKVRASPAVRARARELGIDLAQVRPASDGRVRHADLDAFLAYGAAQGYAAAGSTGADEQVRVVGLRRRTAEAMAAAKRHIPHFSYVEECDVTDLEAARAQLNAELGDRPRLTLLPFLIVAICRSVPAWPMINARFDDEAGIVTRHGAVHLGLATQIPAGLMVPVIRDAQALNLWQLASSIARLAKAARDGSARPEELTGSTLTVTSLGSLGGIASTPIVNRPEVAIIGPNRIVERPMFVPDGLGGERLAKRKLMNLSLSCDHRVIDGWEAASFVQAVKRMLEAPTRLLAPRIDSPDVLP